MWLLYGEDGQTLKTMIAHGAPAILVGNPLYLYFAFPESAKMGSNNISIAATDSEGKTIGSSIDYQSKYFSATFSKAYVGEMIGDFAEGQTYDVFEVEVPVVSDSDGIVMQARTVNITPSVYDVATGESVNIGGFSITILANGKKAVVPMITLSQYQKLLTIIGNMGIASPKGFKNSSYLSSGSEVYMVFFKGIGMVYGKISIASAPESDVWTTISSYDTAGAYELRAKSIALANNSNDSDAEIRAIQNYSTTEKDISGNYIPTTIDIQIFNASVGESIEFSSPISLNYKDSVSEVSDDAGWVTKDYADQTYLKTMSFNTEIAKYLPLSGGTITGAVVFDEKSSVKFNGSFDFTKIPTYKDSELVALSTLQNAFDSTVTANSVITKIGSGYVQNATHASSADSAASAATADFATNAGSASVLGGKKVYQRLSSTGSLVLDTVSDFALFDGLFSVDAGEGNGSVSFLNSSTTVRYVYNSTQSIFRLTIVKSNGSPYSPYIYHLSIYSGNSGAYQSEQSGTITVIDLSNLITVTSNSGDYVALSGAYSLVASAS